MNATVRVEKEIEIATVEMLLPVRYEEEDIPNDFPLRTGDVWRATVDIDTGMIRDWPAGKTGYMYMKVVDEGVYILRDAEGTEVAKIDQDYVPNDLIPGEYGDYVELNIDSAGRIANWPKSPDVSEFFPD